jgi:hypothetical protein
VKDELTVIQLLDREGWDGRRPPQAGSRFRVAAVMLAVVLGCAAAAFLIRVPPGADHHAQEPDEVSVIELPRRNTDSAMPETTTAPGPGGTDSRGDDRSGGGVPSSTTDEERTAVTVTESAAATPGPAVPTGSPTSGIPAPTSHSPTATRSPSKSPPPSQTPTKTTPPCDSWVPWLFC